MSTMNNIMSNSFNGDKFKIIKAQVDLMNVEDYKYLITLTFKNDIQVLDRDLYGCLKTFLHFLNGKLLGQRYESNKLSLEGGVVLENQKNGNPHFHLLIQENESLCEWYQDENNVAELINKLCSKIRRADGLGRAAFSHYGIDARRVYGKEKLIDYLTKTLWENIENLNNISSFKGSEIYVGR